MWGLEAGLHLSSCSRPSWAREPYHTQSSGLPFGLIQACAHQTSGLPRRRCSVSDARSVHPTDIADDQAQTYSNSSTTRGYLSSTQDVQHLQEQYTQHTQQVPTLGYQQHQHQVQLFRHVTSQPDASPGSWPGHSSADNGNSSTCLPEQQQQLLTVADHPQQPYSHITSRSSSGTQKHLQPKQQRHDAAVSQLDGSKQQHQPQRHRSKASSKRPGRHKGPNSSSLSAEQLASRQLTAAISGSSSWQQLHHLLLQDGHSMNHIHACALLSTTSRLVQYHQLDHAEQQQFGVYYVAALQLAFAKAQTSAGPRELTSMLWAVAKVGLHPGPDWLSAYLQAAAVHLQQMNPQDVGLLVWSLARFRHRPEAQWQQQLLAVTQQKMKQFDAQGLCNMLWGLATLDLRPSRSWLAAAVAVAGKLMPKFQPQGLATLLWAVAKLGHQPMQEWLQAAVDAASGKLHAFKPAEVSMVCHGLARLHYRPQDSSSNPSLQETAAVDDAQQPQQQHHQQQFLQQVQAVSMHSMHRLRFAEAANMLWALGVMGQQPQQQWLAAALQQLQHTMQQADGKALANACYGLAKMQQRAHAQFWEAVWQQIPAVVGCSSSSGSTQDPSGAAAAVADPEWQADSQAVATLLLSLAKLGFTRGIPQPVVEALLHASQHHLQQQAMNGGEVAAVAMAAAKCKLKPQRPWLEAVEQSFLLLLQQSLSQVAADAEQQIRQRRRGQQQGAAADEVVLQESSISKVAGPAVEQPSHLQESSLSPQQQQQQVVPQLQEWQLVMKPKEVSNTLISIARLRYVPGADLLQAVQQYQQQYGHLLNHIDQQQLSKALQSLGDQQAALQQQAAVVAVLQGPSAAAAAEAAGTCCHQAAAAAAAEDFPLSGSKGSSVCHCADTNSSSSSSIDDSSGGGNSSTDNSNDSHSTAQEQDHAAVAPAEKALHQSALHLSSSSNGSSSRRNSCEESVLQPYGRYITHFRGRKGPAIWQGAAADEHIHGSQQPSVSEGRRTALAVAVQQAMLAAGGLSVAAS